MQIEIDIPTEQLQVDIPASQVQVDIPSQQVQVNIPAAKIVASGSFLNHTSSLSETSIYTATSAGLFRVNAAVISPDASLQPSLYWNDGVMANIQGIGPGPGDSSFVLYSESGQAISLAAFQSGSGTWSIYYSVESMS